MTRKKPTPPPTLPTPPPSPTKPSPIPHPVGGKLTLVLSLLSYLDADESRAVELVRELRGNGWALRAIAAELDAQTGG